MDYTILLKTGLLLMLLSTGAYAPMTEAQIKATGKLVRNVCQPKHQATDEDIDKMHQGDWNIDHSAMCYMFCVLTSQKLITKENTLDYDLAINLAKTKLPVSFRDRTLVVIEQCKDSAKTLSDKCVASYEISKCIYKANPEVYFFP